MVASFIVASLFFVPERLPFHSGDDTLISPVDGRVRSVEKRDGNVFIEIKKSLFDATTVRAPFDAEILGFERMHGIFLDDAEKAFSRLNEQASVAYRWKNRDVRMRIVCGFYALGLPSVRFGKNVKRGEAQAVLTEGIVELCLPSDVDVAVAVGDRVLGGYSLLSYGTE